MVNTELPLHAGPMANKTGTRLWGMLSAMSTPMQMVNPTQLFATVATVQESKHMDTQPAEPHHATTEEKLRAQLEQAMRDMGTMRLENEGLQLENAQLRSQMLRMSQSRCRSSVAAELEPLEPEETLAPAAHEGSPDSGTDEEGSPVLVAEWAKSLAASNAKRARAEKIVKQEKEKGLAKSRAGAGKEKALPEGWKSHTSQRAHPGEQFFVNTYTGEAQWDFPTESALSPDNPAVQQWAATTIQKILRGRASRRQLEMRLMSEINHMETKLWH